MVQTRSNVPTTSHVVGEENAPGSGNGTGGIGSTPDAVQALRRHAEESATSDARSARPERSRERQTKASDQGVSRLAREIAKLKRRVETRAPYSQPILRTVTPFTPRVMSVPLPANFRPWQIKAYNGTTDPQDHLSKFYASMEAATAPDEVKCRSFLATLEGSACDWFNRLPKGTIDDWDTLAEKFLTHFAANRRQRLPYSHLLNICIRKGEKIRDFITRWEKEARDVHKADDQDLVAMFQAALPRGEEFDDAPDSEDVPAKRAPTDSEEIAKKRKKKKGYTVGPRTPSAGVYFVGASVGTGRELALSPLPHVETYAVSSGAKYCEYHRNNTHNTKECFTLQKEMQRLIARGPAPQDNGAAPSRGPPEGRTWRKPTEPVAVATQARNPEKRHIGRECDDLDEDEAQGYPVGFIHGGNIGGDSAAQRKKWKHMAFVAMVQQAPAPKLGRREQIQFTEKDLPNMPSPHRDALVVRIEINNAIVHRTLVDTGSSSNIMYEKTFQDLGLDRKDLRPVRTPLSGFTGDSIEPEGVITVPVIVGDGAHKAKLKMEFMVVSISCAHNMILGRPGLEDLECVISPYYLCMKFPTPLGIRPTYKPSRALARSWPCASRTGGCLSSLPFALPGAGTVPLQAPMAVTSFQTLMPQPSPFQPQLVSTMAPVNFTRALNAAGPSRPPQDTPGDDQDNDRRRNNRPRERQTAPEKEHIGMIFGGPEGGDLAAQRKKWVRSIYVGEVSAEPPRRKHTRREPIVFTDRDLPPTGEDHNDPLVITMDINGVDVTRVLVDTGNSVNILYLETFQKLRLCRTQLEPLKTPLSGFTGDTVEAEGSIVPPVELGSGEKTVWKKMRFIVVDIKCVHNAILGRPGINRVEAVISMPHLCMKFHTPGGVGEVKGDQMNARECYARAVKKMTKGVNVISQEITKGETREKLEPEAETVEIELHPGDSSRMVRIGANLPEDLKAQITRVLQEYAGIFAWSVADMPGIDRSVICHRLAVREGSRPWAMMLTQFRIEYRPRSAIKGQALADFLVEMTGLTPDLPVNKPTEQWWEMAVDGASGPRGYGGGIVFTTPEGFKIYHAIVFNFKLTNNEAEYEALTGGLRLAQALKISQVNIKSDSSLIVGQVTGNMEAREEHMAQYRDLVLALLKGFEEFKIAQIPRTCQVFYKYPGNKWLEELPHIIWAFRVTPRRAHEETPFSLTYGYEARLPIEAEFPTFRESNYQPQQNEEDHLAELNLVEERRMAAKVKMSTYQQVVKKYHDNKVGPRYFQVGDEVLRRREASRPGDGGKLAKNWEGPYRVRAIIRPGTYRLETLDGVPIERTWNSHHLRKFYK
ncbi:unnamed protein product [Cuscuta campestris]|uniref:RNase H type-1 domain-containing protein n=1 Tax=Cuscuta campestris TaxID=132261 RepID=A0A484KIX8_9ASTE|nr:unnamed protein product [Cuscuta campestris]